MPGNAAGSNGSRSAVGADWARLGLVIGCLGCVRGWSECSAGRPARPVQAVARSGDSRQHDRMAARQRALRRLGGFLCRAGACDGHDVLGRCALRAPVRRIAAELALPVWTGASTCIARSLQHPAIVAVVHRRRGPDRQQHRGSRAGPLHVRPTHVLRVDAPPQPLRPPAVGRRRPRRAGRLVCAISSTGAIASSPAGRSTVPCARPSSACDGRTCRSRSRCRTATTAGS